MAWNRHIFYRVKTESTHWEVVKQMLLLVETGAADSDWESASWGSETKRNPHLQTGAEAQLVSFCWSRSEDRRTCGNQNTNTGAALVGSAPPYETCHYQVSPLGSETGSVWLTELPSGKLFHNDSNGFRKCSAMQNPKTVHASLSHTHQLMLAG